MKRTLRKNIINNILVKEEHKLFKKAINLELMVYWAQNYSTKNKTKKRITVSLQLRPSPLYFFDFCIGCFVSLYFWWWSFSSCWRMCLVWVIFSDMFLLLIKLTLIKTRKYDALLNQIWWFMMKSVKVMTLETFA